MIVVTAHMWPGGNAGNAYELMSTTITNNGASPGDGGGDTYFAHVLTRPAPHLGTDGYEADVEVTRHQRADGFVPLLISVLAAAHVTDDTGVKTPPSRALARLVLHDMHAFEQRLKGRKL